MIEGLRLVRFPIHRAVGAAVAGMAVHVTKFWFLIAYSGVTGILRNFRFWGTLPSLWNHVLFGLGGGLIGWAAVRSGRLSAWLRRFR